MVITLSPELEAALNEQARKLGTTPEALALKALQQRFVPLEPRDEWERRLLSLAKDCGPGPPDWALSREAMYD